MQLRPLLFGGIMAGLAAMLQTAPTWMGQPIGFALAILATLPMALAAAVGPRAAAIALLVATLLCILLQPEEGWIFGLTNGPFGLALGISARRGNTGPRATLLPTTTLLIGMALLTWGVSLPALGPDLLALGLPEALGSYALFALVWSTLFMPVTRLLIRRTRPAWERWADQGRLR